MILRERKTIPTIHSIMYLMDILKGMARGECSFEEIRRKVAMARLNIELRERVAPSIRQQYLDEKSKEPSYMWNQSVKNMRELMQLGLVNERPLKYGFTSGDKADNEQARLEKYELTEDGRYLARLAESDYNRAVNHILDLMYKVHPRFRAFIEILQNNEVLLFPELTAKMVEGVPIHSREYLSFVCKVASELIQQRYGSNFYMSESETASNLEGYVIAKLRSTKSSRGTFASFAIKSVNRGIKNLILIYLGLKVDIPSFEVMTNWCKQFRICNFARGLPDMHGLTLYSTAYVKANGKLIIKRRSKESVLDSVVGDIPRFFYQFKTKGSPWASIYPIRAAVCFKNRIDDEVFDEIIGDIFDKRVSVNYKLALETDLWALPPRSTRPLILDGDKKRNIVSIYEWKGE